MNKKLKMFKKIFYMKMKTKIKFKINLNMSKTNLKILFKNNNTLKKI